MHRRTVIFIGGLLALTVNANVICNRSELDSQAGLDPCSTKSSSIGPLRLHQQCVFAICCFAHWPSSVLCQFHQGLGDLETSLSIGPALIQKTTHRLVQNNSGLSFLCAVFPTTAKDAPVLNEDAPLLLARNLEASARTPRPSEGTGCCESTGRAIRQKKLSFIQNTARKLANARRLGLGFI